MNAFKIFLFALLITIVGLESCKDNEPVVPEEELLKVNKNIGPDGGILNLANGKAILEIPAGGLVDTTINITIREITDIEDENVIPGTTYALEPSGTQFAEPVKFTIQYDPEEIPEDTDLTNLFISKYLDNGEVQLFDTQPDETNNTFSTDILSFSRYGVSKYTSANCTNGGGGNSGPPSFSGNLNALFVGHSAMNMIVDDYVAILANQADSDTQITRDQVTNGDISLVGKMDREHGLFDGDNSHEYDFAVLTEQWGYQDYNPDLLGRDSNDALNECAPADYEVPSLWIDPEEDWAPIPYYLQQYADALECGNNESVTFYYQTWSLGYDEVANGATRAANQNYQRPTIAEMEQMLINENAWPDLPLADRIEFEGVKWQYFVRSAKRSHIEFIPAAFALSRLMRAIEAGEVPGFEAVATTGGLTADGTLAWTDYLFYQDQYHLATVGHYFMSLVIYAAVFDQSPEGLEIGSGQFLTSEWFPEDQYDLEGISNERYQELLQETGAAGIYELRGHNDLDYMHDDLRDYLQRLAWDVVQNDSSY